MNIGNYSSLHNVGDYARELRDVEHIKERLKQTERIQYHAEGGPIELYIKVGSTCQRFDSGESDFRPRAAELLVEMLSEYEEFLKQEIKDWLMAADITTEVK